MTGNILLQTTSSALGSWLGRAASESERAYFGDLLARSVRGGLARSEVEAIASGDEHADWIVIRQMAQGLGLAPSELAFRALSVRDLGDDGAEMIDDDDDAETPAVKGYRFVMSTADSDRARDVIAQDWILSEFSPNPVAPWAHRYDQPVVGVWRKVGVHHGQLRGTLVPRPLASYPLSETVAAQLADGTLRTVSVGLYPRAVMRRSDLAEDDPAFDARGGLYIMGPTLLECSPTPMPMNQNALRLRSAPAKPAPAPAEAPGLPWATRSTARERLPWATAKH